MINKNIVIEYLKFKYANAGKYVDIHQMSSYNSFVLDAVLSESIYNDSEMFDRGDMIELSFNIYFYDLVSEYVPKNNIHNFIKKLREEKLKRILE
jgi:hypothetical protein